MQRALPRPRDASGTSRLRLALDSFREGLNDDQRTELDAISVTPHPRAVLQFTADLDAKNAQRQSRCIAARVQTVLDSVQSFSSIVETYVSSNPKIAAIVWGSVKLALLVASNFATYFDKITKLFMTFSRHCPRYAEYQAIFATSPRLQERLCAFYATLVECCTQAVQAIQRPGWTQLVRSTLTSFDTDFAPYETQLRLRSKDVNEEIRLSAIKILDQERKAQNEERALALRHRERVEHDINGIHVRNLQIDNLTAETRKQTLLDKLSDFDYCHSFRSIRYRTVNNTACWLSRTNRFQTWRERKYSSLLICHGKIGSGKSFLMASAIMQLFQEVAESDRIAYFFCSHDNVASLKANTILSSLIKQLLNPDNIDASLELTLKAVLSSQDIFYPDLEPLLLKAVSLSRVQYLFIDAIDECSDIDRKKVLKALAKVMHEPKRQIKLCLSTRDRHVASIKSLSSTELAVSTESSKARGDLEDYITHTLEMKLSDEDLIVRDQSLIDEIRNVLVALADGMFLWVDFQISDICSATSDVEIREVLKRLPRGLPETYNRILGRIKQSGRETQAVKIFKWMACVRRPLSLEEIVQAISLSPDQHYIIPERYVNDVRRIPSWFYGLIMCDEEYDIVQFPHATVKEFLLDVAVDSSNKTFHVDHDEANLEIGELCVTYLNFNDFKKDLIRKPQNSTRISPEDIAHAALQNAPRQPDQKALSKLFLTFHKRSKKSLGFDMNRLHLTGSEEPSTNLKDDSYAFLNYASHFWIFHTVSFSPDRPDMWRLWTRLLSLKDSFIFHPWINANSPVEPQGMNRIICEFIIQESHGALLSFINDGTDEELGYFLKQWNAGFDEYDVEWLLETSMKTDNFFIFNKILDLPRISTEARGHALVTAAEYGYRACVIQLLTRLNLRQKWRVGGTYDLIEVGKDALSAAIMNNYVHIVEDLIASGANVNGWSKEFSGYSFLQVSTRLNKTNIMEALLRGGARTETVTPGKGGRTTLQMAAESGNYKGVKLLLAYKANVNRPPGEISGRTALQAAAGGGHLDIVETLLEKGANINAPPSDTDGRTALQAAASGGHLDVVETLLKNGADVHAPPGRVGGVSALQAAQEKTDENHVQIEQRLRAAGANDIVA